jgi:hypothetical protein
MAISKRDRKKGKSLCYITCFFAEYKEKQKMC